MADKPNSFDTTILDPIMKPAYNVYKTVKNVVNAVRGTRDDVAQAAKANADKSKQEDDYKKQTTDKASPSTFKRGGKVQKSGFAKVHKGERVLTKKQQKSYSKGKVR